MTVVAVRMLVLPDDGVAHGKHGVKAEGGVQPGKAPRDAVVEALVPKGAGHEPRGEAQGKSGGVGSVAEAVRIDADLERDHGQAEEEEWPAHGDIHMMRGEVGPAVAAEGLLWCRRGG